MPTKKPVKSRGFGIGCAFIIVPEQKARLSYDNILRFLDDPDVIDPIRFLRQRELVHFQRFGDALRMTKDQLDSRNYYAFNPEFDGKNNRH